MKNKLTNEEKALQSKLEEASFEYSEANWSELQNAMGKKGVFSNFSPLLKAIIGFTILAGAVFVINNTYLDEGSTPAANTENIVVEKVQTKDQKESSNTVTVSNENKETPIATGPINESANSQSNDLQKQAEESKQILEQLVQEEKKALDDKMQASSQEETIPVISGNEVTIHSIELLNNICLNTELHFEAKISKSVQEDLYFQWLIDKKEIQEYFPKASYLFTEPGKHTIELIIGYEENVLAKSSRDIYVQPSPSLDFIATDLTDVFYDENVNVKVVNPIKGEYRWLDEDNVVHFGKEAVFSFVNEGKHNVRLEYISAENCKTTIDKDVFMKKDFNAAFPNAFSTNGDGLNETFELKVLQIPNTQFEMQILDFSGKTVFKTNDVYEGWNGQLNNTGTAFDRGTFVWTAVIENNNGKRRQFNGKVIVNPRGLKK